MNSKADQDRRDQLIEKLQSFDGVNQPMFDRLIAQLDFHDQPFGFDADGRFRVAFFDAKSYDQKSFNDLNTSRICWNYLPASLSLETVGIVENTRAVCIFVNDTCDAAVVDELALRGVQLIALRCAGYNNVDLEACQRAGIQVVRVPAYSPHAVAEHAVALMLMLNRRLHHAYVRNRSGSFVLDGLTGFDMRGKTIGVVGTGMIGKCLAKIMLGFGCRVLAFDKDSDSELQQQSDVQYVDLDSLLAQSDVISLHVPLFDETYHLIDEQAIEKMKPGVMVINTSRGGLVDARSLIEGLKNGRIGAAGLDVYEEEAGIFFHDRSTDILADDVLARLMTFSNVVITSHQAFLTKEALQGIAQTTLENIEEFLDADEPATLRNAVRPQP